MEKEDIDKIAEILVEKLSDIDDLLEVIADEFDEKMEEMISRKIDEKLSDKR